MARLESDPSSAVEIQRMGLWAALVWAALGWAARGSGTQMGASTQMGTSAQSRWAVASLLAPFALFTLPPGTRSFAVAALVIAVFAWSWERQRRHDDSDDSPAVSTLAAWAVCAQLVLRAGALLPGDPGDPRFWLRLLGLPLLVAWSTQRLGRRFGRFSALSAAAAALILGPGATAHSTLALLGPALLLEAMDRRLQPWRRLAPALALVLPFFWEPRAALLGLASAALVASRTEPPRRWWLPRCIALAAAAWIAALWLPARSPLPAIAAPAVALILLLGSLRAGRRLCSLQTGLLAVAALLAALGAAPPWLRADPLLSTGRGVVRWAFGRPFESIAPLLEGDAVLSASAPVWEVPIGAAPRRLALESNLSNAADLAPGTEVARLVLRAAGDGSTLYEAPLRSGIETAEWAARRADLADSPAARSPAPWRSSFTPDPSFFGQTYRAEIPVPDFDPPLRLAIVRSPALPTQTTLVLRAGAVALRGPKAFLSKNDPFRGTLFVLPLVLALFVLTERLARGAGARETRPTLAGKLACAALVIGAITRARLALPHFDAVLAAGFLLLLAARVASQLVALRPVLGARLPRRPSLAFFLLPLTVYLAILPWSTAQRPPDGDEPYYLLIAHSLAYDFDTDLKNNYAAEDYRRFVDRPLEPQLGDPTGPRGEVFSRHNELLPLLLTPAYAAYGKNGALAAMAALAAALAWITLRVARHYAREHPGAALTAYGLLAFASPLLFFSGQVWVEVPAALLAMVSLDHLLMLRYERHWGAKQWIGVALPILLLPLLKLRLMFLAIPLLALAWWRAGRPRKPLLIVAGLLAAVLSGVLLYNNVVFGNPLKIHGWEEVDPGRYPVSSYAHGALGFFFDGAFGLFAFFPVWLILIAAFWRLVRDRHPLLVDLLILGGPYLLMVGRRREWFGGWSPPFRYALVVLPLLAIALVPALLRRRSAGARCLAGGLGALTLALTLLWLIVPGWTYNFADGRGDLVDRLEERWRLDVGRFVPSGVRPNPALWCTAAACAVAVPAIWAAGRRRRRGGWTGAGALFVAAAFCAVPHAARRAPTHAVELEDPWVHKVGGHVYPDLWTVDRPRYPGGWTLRGGERAEARIVPGGRRVSVRLTVRYVRNTPAPIRLAIAAGEQTLAQWTAERPDVWQALDFGPFDWPPGLPLVVSAVGPAAETPLAGLIVDRVELAWK